ncbi:hypothetical protein GCM10007425_29020 [Lysinibacillus alkalisoli]|uniref:CamS family sex pheromone protein n=1 Tax=Lysinibacillus alkalisoli TaxID=1911548 RepID=A0A917G9Y7_9BACI|nr:CamS family sex pheromone protein [Lysinibacillus alkalisoli]GGG32558.1 hypothetical protein GCM10007425_29020 [Lysinibacillus alkalisoli]
MKWTRFIPVLATAVVLSACTPAAKPETDVVQEDEKKVEKTTVPVMQVSDEYYKALLPVKESASRGLIVSNVFTKYDIKEAESGLMRVSQNEFSTKDFFIQEGQFLDKETVGNWLARSNQAEGGLNPSDEGLSPEQRATEAPIYLAHIIEQNYLKRTDDDKVTLGGVTIGLALNSIYYYQKEQYGEYYEEAIPMGVLEQEGKKIADEVYKRLREREELKNVPIVVGLYKQKARNDVVPGTYFAYSVGKSGADQLGEWSSIDEEYVLFPTSDVTDKYRAINTSFQNFKQNIDKFFSNTTNVIGRGFYQGDTLKKLSIELPIQFYGETETIGFTQYIAGEIFKNFPADVLIEVNINSIDGIEAIIVREPNEKEPTVHMLN